MFNNSLYLRMLNHFINGSDLPNSNNLFDGSGNITSTSPNGEMCIVYIIEPSTNELMQQNISLEDFLNNISAIVNGVNIENQTPPKELSKEESDELEKKNLIKKAKDNVYFFVNALENNLKDDKKNKLNHLSSRERFSKISYNDIKDNFDFFVENCDYLINNYKNPQYFKELCFCLNESIKVLTEIEQFEMCATLQKVNIKIVDLLNSCDCELN